MTTAREALERVKRAQVSDTGLNSPEEDPPPRRDPSDDARRANASLRTASKRNRL